MAWTTRNSLNRWCLRSLLDEADAPLEHQLDKAREGNVQPITLRKGPPPLVNACIAPHCEAWSPLDEERGVCVFREKVRSNLSRK